MPKLTDIFPEEPGVYIMRNRNNDVLYVGKARSLLNRLRSYLNPDDPRIIEMVNQIEDIDYIVTSSELEALILENNLIKEYKPPYNIRLKDDKTYPYILITNERYPTLTITRRIEDRGEYFGPYTSTQALRATIHMIRKRFKIRSCLGDLSRYKNACLNYHLGLCLAPCTNDSPSLYREYQENVKEVIRLLNGNGKEIIASLKEEMFKRVAELDFEKAIVLRDQIKALEKTIEKQRVVSKNGVEADVFALFNTKSSSTVAVLFIRRGNLIGEEDFELDHTGEEDILGAFITAFYRNGNYVPPLIVINQEIKGYPLLEEWLSSRRNGKVSIRFPKSGELKDFLEIAKKNAIERFNQKVLKIEDPLVSLQELLGLPKIPEIIEGYDISNIRGKEAVGSMVVFRNGEPDKSSYRRFKIKTVEGPNDFGMMQEVLWRRLNNEKWALPDLILIDGGLGQVTAVKEVIESKGYDVPLIGLAKREEVIWLPDGNKFKLPRRSEALKLLQRIRDEAHRFAVRYHHKLRETALKPELLEVPGIGEKRMKKILSSYPDISKLKDVSIEEIVKRCSIPKNIAERIKEWVENTA
ncbi:MAG: excinuclease ABC subunit UvrC [bacterium]